MPDCGAISHYAFKNSEPIEQPPQAIAGAAPNMLADLVYVY
jgi:hypothetical protein